ncbi:hypothetical protein JCM4814A_80710 [Streptomyces phaeofaciens JCM 4814]|uniref:Insertion element IS402-like domain-containing protein n=1 Tax=Streptomyces phaeofaciens TaxID=68254 RepID=A0A918M1Q8_9ACTN|nr:hypothetical protein GCM10010226_86330 [Streptomyces phaeofaciens]
MWWVGVSQRLRTGAPRRDLPERYGPWQTVYERLFARWENDGSWARLLEHVQVKDDAVGAVEWTMYGLPRNSGTSLGGEATRTAPARSYLQGRQPWATGVPTPAGVCRRRDAAAARAQPLGQGALRCELNLRFPAEVLAGELHVLPDVGRRDPTDPAEVEEDAESGPVHTVLVGEDLQAIGLLLGQCRDQEVRDLRESEPADGERAAWAMSATIELSVCAVLQGAIFAGVKATVDRGGAIAARRLTDPTTPSICDRRTPVRGRSRRGRRRPRWR